MLPRKIVFQEVDISSFSMALTLDNCIRTDCSVPVTMTPVSLMVPWPEEESRLLAPIHPFHWTVRHYMDKTIKERIIDEQLISVIHSGLVLSFGNHHDIDIRIGILARNFQQFGSTKR